MAFFIILFSYLSGSIPFGLILTKIFSNQDIRKIGSGKLKEFFLTGNRFGVDMSS